MEARTLPPITPSTRMTEAEFRAFERASEEKYEFWNGLVVPKHGWLETETGELVAMAGASPNHNQLKGNLAGILGAVLTPRGCRAGVGAQHVALPSGDYVYPDLVFVCGPPRYSDDPPPILLNPTFLIEVASPTTSERDRGAKLRAYTQIESVQTYWMFEPNEPTVTMVERQPGGGWGLGFAMGLEAVARSEGLDMEVPLAEAYALVDLPAGGDGEG